jgi:hypothetical protein
MSASLDELPPLLTPPGLRLAVGGALSQWIPLVGMAVTHGGYQILARLAS